MRRSDLDEVSEYDGLSHKVRRVQIHTEMFDWQNERPSISNDAKKGGLDLE